MNYMVHQFLVNYIFIQAITGFEFIYQTFRKQPSAVMVAIIDFL